MRCAEGRAAGPAVLLLRRYQGRRARVRDFRGPVPVRAGSRRVVLEGDRRRTPEEDRGRLPGTDQAVRGRRRQGRITVVRDGMHSAALIVLRGVCYTRKDGERPALSINAKAEEIAELEANVE